MNKLRKKDKSEPRSAGKERGDIRKSKRALSHLGLDPRRLEVLDPFIRSELVKLADCVRSVMEVAHNFEKLDRYKNGDDPVLSGPNLPSGKYSGVDLHERRRTEQRRRLIAQIHADLIEIISSEVGSDIVLNHFLESALDLANPRIRK